MTDPHPADVPWLTPYLTVRAARVSIAFYEKALGFAVRDSVNDDGTVIHVEMTYRGQLIVMFAPEGAYGSQTRTPKSAGQMAPQSFYLLSTTSMRPLRKRSPSARSRSSSRRISSGATGSPRSKTRTAIAGQLHDTCTEPYPSQAFSLSADDAIRDRLP